MFFVSLVYVWVQFRKLYNCFKFSCMKKLKNVCGIIHSKYPGMNKQKRSKNFWMHLQERLPLKVLWVFSFCKFIGTCYFFIFWCIWKLFKVFYELFSFFKIYVNPTQFPSTLILMNYDTWIKPHEKLNSEFFKLVEISK